MDQFYIYRFIDPTGEYLYSGVSHPLIFDDAVYDPVTISHSVPTFSSDPSQARVTVSLRDDLQVAMNYISHPPPFKTELRIYEVLETSISGNSLQVEQYEPHWSGRIVRIAWRDNFQAVEMLCKTQQEIHFARETNNESLHPLCRFHLGDGRCPVNIEDFKETVTVEDKSDDVSEPSITVSGLIHPDSYYKAGMVRLADQDYRTVEKAETSAGDKVLTISRSFPDTSVQIGDSVEVFAGDDLTQEVCSVVFGAATNGGEAWGGWKLTPSRDFQKDGIV